MDTKKRLLIKTFFGKFTTFNCKKVVIKIKSKIKLFDACFETPKEYFYPKINKSTVKERENK
jgi:hypothetical protein